MKNKKKNRKSIKKGKGYSPNTTQRKLSSLKKRFATRKIQTAFRKDKCAICLDRINKKIKDKCHNFHSGCINSWIERGNRSCPLCRTPIGLQRFQDIYDINVLNRYNTLFQEYIEKFNELKKDFNEIDPEYLNLTEDNNSINDRSLNSSIDIYLEICRRYINIINNQSSISQDLIEIMENIETTKNDIEKLISDLEYDHWDVLMEIAYIRGTE